MYFMAIVIPYTVIFVLETLYTSLVFVETNFTKSFLLAISFKVLVTTWTIF